jgi:hypothetical protein
MNICVFIWCKDAAEIVWLLTVDGPAPRGIVSSKGEQENQQYQRLNSRMY